MFLHNFKFSFKVLFRNRALIFWTFAFPIFLGIFFKMAFSNIENNERLALIDIAIVENQEFNQNLIFKSSFSYLSDEENKERLFKTKYVDEEEAKSLLNDGKITGYLKFENNTPNVVVMKSGINETVFKFVTEEVLMSSTVIDEFIKNNNDNNIDFAAIYNKVMEMTENNDVNIENISNKNLSYTMIEFYTLIAMACLYSGMLGMTSINYSMANISNNGKRVSITPISKIKIVLSSVLASYIAALMGIALLITFSIFVLKVDFGNNLSLVSLLAACGCLAGLSMGIAIGICFKFKEGAKEGLLLAITMLGCFLSGMMGITMKYVIDKNIPIVNKLNPASMITDGLYSLYYYDTLNRYWLNLCSLLIFSAVLITISFLKLRRVKYDSI